MQSANMPSERPKPKKLEMRLPERPYTRVAEIVVVAVAVVDVVVGDVTGGIGRR